MNAAFDPVREVTERQIGSPSKDVLAERLALFWSNHFTLGDKDPLSQLLAGPYNINLRQHMFGSFRDLLKAAVLHLAMMHYLNLQQAIGPNSQVGQKRRCLRAAT
jgi:uncharacterized protein (DUF1800 family)